MTNESPRIFLTPQSVTSKPVINSHGSASPQFTSFLSELPPSIVCRQTVELQAKRVTMQALSSAQKEDAASIGRMSGVLDHSTSSQHEDQGMFHSSSSIGIRPVDREPTPSAEGMGRPQALSQPTPAGASRSLLALPLDTTRDVSSKDSLGTHNSKLSKNVLL